MKEKSRHKVQVSCPIHRNPAGHALGPKAAGCEGVGCANGCEGVSLGIALGRWVGLEVQSKGICSNEKQSPLATWPPKENPPLAVLFVDVGARPPRS